MILFFLAIAPLSAFSLERAKDFELQALDGRHYRLSDLKGRVVLLNFWATWCKYCVKENPSLERLYRRFKEKGFIVLGISIDRSAMVVEKFLKKKPVSYPVLLDPRGDVFVKTYTLIGIPVTIIINKEGYIVAKYQGGQDFDSERFITLINALIKADG